MFGQSLGEFDRHLIEAVRQVETRRLAISIRPGPNEEIIGKKAHYIELFPRADIRFFNSQSHPLGSLTLNVIDAV